MRTCSCCGQDKELEEFSWHVRSKGLRHYTCKSCVRTKSRAWYVSNKATHIKHTVEAGRRRRELVRSWLEAQNLACSSCGENHPAVIEFHHTDPNTKEHNVSDLVGRGSSLQKIQQEIDKCIVLCSNCHRKVHWSLS